MYTFTYLGAEIASDGDPEVSVKHRTDIAWGHFSDYRKTLMAAKLPVDMRTHGIHHDLRGRRKLQQKVNGTNSKMLSLITKRSIHQEARTPTFNIVDYIMNRRWEYLGHILRMDPSRIIRRSLLELLPNEAPYTEGSLLSDSQFQTVEETIAAASDRDHWKGLCESRRR